MSSTPEQRRWSSGFMFFAAAIGSAVGISNIWKFTYVAGENGGGAFVLIYILAIALIAFPALTAEFLIGRRGGASVGKSLANLSQRDGISNHWKFYGWMAVAGAFIALSFYSVVAGWTIDYFVLALSSGFAGQQQEAASAELGRLLSSPGRMMLSQVAFLTFTAVVVSAGVRNGLERALKWMTPGLFLILVLLLIYSLVAGDIAAALRFLFVADFDQVNANTILMAVGQAFFSLGIGLGVLMTVAAYMNRDIPLIRAAAVVAFADGFVALLAGLAIFPIVFANNLSPAEGPGLIFATLPVAFGQMPGGAWIGPLFFLLMALAALTSAITILETVIAWLEDYTKLSRRLLTALTTLALWAFGLVTVFSFNIWSEVRPAWFIPVLADRDPFGVLDYIVSNLMMPAGGVAVAVIAGWSLSRAAARDELHHAPGWLFECWRFLARYIVPLAVVLIFIANMGG